MPRPYRRKQRDFGKFDEAWEKYQKKRLHRNRYHCVKGTMANNPRAGVTLCGIVLDYPRKVTWDWERSFVSDTESNKRLTRCKTCHNHKTVGLAYLKYRVKQC